MPVSIVTRIGKGAPLTPVEHDQNLTNLKNAIDANTLSITGRVTQATIDAFFEGTSTGGKKQVDWTNVLNAPTSSFMPVGAVLDFAGPLVPDGYLLCDGSAVSRVTYVTLYNLLGAVFGAGDGSTTFNVPDFRGRTSVGRGVGDATGATTWSLGQKKGEETHILTIPELPAHKHNLQQYGGNGISSGGTDLTPPQNSKGLNPTVYNFLTDSIGGDTPHNNLQPSLTISKIIKF